MGLRETVNKNPGITTGVTAGIIVLALVFIIWQNMGSSPSASDGAQVYYTNDDGDNYFADDAKKVPPFDYKGKPAYLAHVYKCKGGKPFVQYVERYTPDGKKKMEAARSAKNPDLGLFDGIMKDGLEVKLAKTGDKGWVKQDSPEYLKITTPKCPDGSAEIEPVVPD